MGEGARGLAHAFQEEAAADDDAAPLARVLAARDQCEEAEQRARQHLLVADGVAPPRPEETLAGGAWLLSKRDVTARLAARSESPRRFECAT
jgi:hypothetical protein